MKKNFAKRLLVAAMLTTWVANPTAVLAVDVDSWSALSSEIANNTSQINVTNALNADGTISTAVTSSIIGGTLESPISITGDQANRFFTLNTGADVSFSGLEMTNGYNAVEGGAISSAGKFTISNSNFIGNKISIDNSNGGGALFVNSGSTAVSNVIENSVFSNNEALSTDALREADGGAISLRTGALTINDTDFVGNKADVGGAVYVRNQGENVLLTMNGGKFENNQATLAGGALMVMSNAVLNGVKFIRNRVTANDDGGGALFLGAVSNVTLRDVEFDGNISSTRGGAIATRAAVDADNSAAILTMERVVFKNNEAATTGGAIDNYLYNNTTLKDVTFDSNTAAKGGAIYNHGDPVDKAGGAGTITIEAAEFINNTASEGGGAIYNDSDLVLDTSAGDITFSNNSVNGVVNDIHTIDAVSITGDSNTISLNTITGSGSIDKTGANTLALNDNNDGYTGVFTQTSGITQVFKKFFGGNSTLEDSSIEMKDGSTIVAGSSVTVDNGADVTIDSNATVSIAGAIATATGSTGEVVNKGSVTIEDGASVIGNVVNEGSITLNEGSTLTGSIVQDTVNASITVNDGASFGTTEKIDGGKLTIASGATLTTDLEVTQAVMLDVGSSLTMDDEGISIGGAYIKGAELNLASADIAIVDGGSITTDLTLSGSSVITPETGNIVKIGDGISSNILTLGNEFSTDASQLYEVSQNATLKLAPNKGSYLTLNSDVTGTGNVIVDEIVTDRNWGVGTVNIASDNSGFSGNFIQKMGDIILKTGSKFFGGTNVIESGTLTAQTGSEVGGVSNTIQGGAVDIQSGATLSGITNTVEGGTLNLQDGAILASAVTATTNTTNNTYGTVNLYNGIKGSIVDLENADAVIIAADEIANGNNGLLTYVNADSTEQTISLNDGVGLGLFNGTTIQGDVNLQEDKGVRDLALGNGSGILSDDPEAILVLGLGDNTSLSYYDGAVIQDNSTVQMGANSSLNFNNNSDNVDYNAVITSSESSASINKNGSSAVTIKSSLAGFNGSVSTTGGSLHLANTDSVNLNNISANNSSLTVAGDLSANNASFTGASSVINLKGAAYFAGNATLSDATLNTNNSITIDNTLTIASTGTNTPSINLMGGGVNTITADTINLNSNSNITFDADPRSSSMDQIIANNIITNGNTSDPYKLIISGINFTRSPIDKNVNLDISNLLSDSTGSQSSMVALKDGGVVANSAMGRYLITSSAASNALNATLMQLNPQMYRGQVATIASWQNQLVVNNMMFDHMQVVTRQLMDEERTANKYAAAYPQFAPYQYSAKDGSLWYKAYGVFETLSMTKGLHVGNNAYGSLIGADFPLVNLKNGWKLVPTAYVGYNGGHQHYDGVSMYQNGAQLGMMGTAYKGDFLTSLLAYGGGYGNDMTVRGQYGNGSDNTGNWFAGVASKTAYNFHLTKDLIFQPTALVSYNAFGAQNWGSNFGAMSMSTGMLNGINAAPGFNLIWQKKSFSLYATAQMVYNIMGAVNGTAGNIDTGNVRMKHAYFEYGIGAMKQLKERFSGYLQITIRNGGRTGIGFQGGMNWKVGK